jgi:hypothetical protein
MSVFRESSLFRTPIQNLGLAIENTRLAPIIDEFRDELRLAGITTIQPRFHLSTEWGVPFGTIVIGIPFYLARPDLTELHSEETGHVEGFNRRDILRYLRHEMGHVVNYAFRLYDQEDWVKTFGSITQPYLEDYRPQPFSRRFVRHLPGWYAQKHPDEDWSETFAVWMTPGINWREQYSHWNTALSKLQFCDRLMDDLRTRTPLVTAADLDEDVGELNYSLQDFYGRQSAGEDVSPGLDGDLRSIFDDLNGDESPSSNVQVRPAGSLIRRLERTLMADIFCWTGHFPERTRALVRHLAERAETLRQVYPETAEEQVIVAVTVLVTSLAMNHVHRGGYFPENPSAIDTATPQISGD